MGRRGGESKRNKSEKLAQDGGDRRVICFYSHAPGKKYREFSNFFMQQKPYKFHLPECARQEDSLPSYILCEFSEKAIMATKAALMNDPETFAEIVKSKDPKSCKDLGRRVRNWDQDRWDMHIEEIAFEVVLQKFESDTGLKKLLLETGDSLIAEAAPADQIWGIGLGCSDPRAANPSKWRGTNILGNALMRTRDHFRSRASESIKAAEAEDNDKASLVEDVNGVGSEGPPKASEVASPKRERWCRRMASDKRSPCSAELPQASNAGNEEERAQEEGAD